MELNWPEETRGGTRAERDTAAGARHGEVARRGAEAEWEDTLASGAIKVCRSCGQRFD